MSAEIHTLITTPSLAFAHIRRSLSREHNGFTTLLLGFLSLYVHNLYLRYICFNVKFSILTSVYGFSFCILGVHLGIKSRIYVYLLFVVPFQESFFGRSRSFSIV